MSSHEPYVCLLNPTGTGDFSAMAFPSNLCAPMPGYVMHGTIRTSGHAKPYVSPLNADPRMVTLFLVWQVTYLGISHSWSLPLPRWSPSALILKHWAGLRCPSFFFNMFQFRFLFLVIFLYPALVRADYTIDDSNYSTLKFSENPAGPVWGPFGSDTGEVLQIQLPNGTMQTIDATQCYDGT